MIAPRTWTATLLVAAASGALLLVPAAASPVTPVPTSLISCAQANERVVVTTSARLDPSCTYTAGFDIVASNVRFDCLGATLRGTVGRGGIGIHVVTPADVDMSNVTIRNCRIDGFLNSIHLSRTGFQSLAAGEEYVHHLSDVMIEDSILTSSTGVGIYVDGYVTDTTMRRLTIAGSGSTGIYLDTGSARNIVRDNVIIYNGYRESGPNGTNTTFAGVPLRYWGPGREGIAIDGSRDNLVARNLIAGNSAGGVFLYTNCGENVHNDPGSWVEHRYGSEYNRVERNTVVGGHTGVWVASRMGENVFPMDCSDEPYVSGSAFAVTLDRAANNIVRYNAFAHLTYGVRVEDDGTIVARNDFAGVDATHHAIIVGTPFRAQVLDHPVTNTLIVGNRSTIVGNASPYRWVDGVRALSAANNVALARVVDLCQAPDIPRTALIFVYALAYQDPNGPPVAKPDYTVPELGALAPCSA